MKRYEALIIINTQGKEEGIQDQIDRVKGDMQKLGIKVSSVQKLDKRQFAYASNGLTSGTYVNYIFEAEPELAHKLQTRFLDDVDVYRIQVTNSPLQVRKSRTPAPTATT
ncbi:MAG: 30S ribosomal protein S6 [Verrucomicrobiota bacterium]|nr:30S ribosomal protein S6 [Verrucomicrobiota bacterium]